MLVKLEPRVGVNLKLAVAAIAQKGIAGLFLITSL